MCSFRGGVLPRASPEGGAGKTSRPGQGGPTTSPAPAHKVLSTFSGQEMASLVWAHATLGINNPMLMEELAKRLVITEVCFFGEGWQALSVVLPFGA